MFMSPRVEFLLSLAGSVSLLLWGSYMLRAAVEKAYSSKISTFICSASGSRLKSFSCGVASAVVLQSTTATILLTTSFVSAGLLSLAVAIVVILGADLGSAFAARILFLDLSFLAPLLLLTGLCFHRFSKTWKRQQLGRIIIGLGLMLLAIQLIKQVVAPMAAQPVSPELMAFLTSASWLMLIITALVTWIAHSGVAVVLVIASMAGTGIISDEISTSAVLGANVGSGLIALLLVSRRNLDAYSAVLANFLMRAVLSVIVLILSSLILPYIDMLGDQPGIRIINFHIAFNIVLAVLFVPFNVQLADFCRSLLESRQPENILPESHAPGSCLDPNMVSKPVLALSCARREAFRLADNTEALFMRAMDMFDVTDRLVIEQFVARDSEINARNKAIQGYLSEVRRIIHDKEGSESGYEKVLDGILRFSTTLENIGDVVSHNLARLAVKRLDRDVRFSSVGSDELREVHEEVLKLIQLEITNFSADGMVKSKARDKLIDSIRDLSRESMAKHRQRLSNRKSNSMSTSSIHQDTLRDLMQVVNLIANIKIG